MDSHVPGQKILLIGQERLRKQLTPFIQSSDPMPHTMLLGPSGIGKTHLARWVAQERGEAFEELLEARPQDIPPSGIALLDEIHRLRKPEWLYPIMEDHEVTVIAATTRPDQLEPALKTRFLLTLTLQRLTRAESETLLCLLLDEGRYEDLGLLAGATAGNPRQATRIATVANVIGPNDEAVLASVEITADGVTGDQIRYLQTLNKISRPAGITQVAALMAVDEATVRETEPYLLELGLIDLTTSGRTLTGRGRKYLKLLEE